MSQLMIWLGSGFAFAVGCMIGVVFSGAILGRKNKKWDEQSAEANKYLAERNEISRNVHERLIEIRDALLESR
jgi:hypothetical protein